MLRGSDVTQLSLASSASAKPRRRRRAATSRPARSDDARLHRAARSGSTTRSSASAAQRSQQPATRRTSPTRSGSSPTSRRRRSRRASNRVGRPEPLDPAARRRSGVVGFALGVATFAQRARGSALQRARRDARFVGAASRRGWILVAAGTWNAVGIVAGHPARRGHLARARARRRRRRSSPGSTPVTSARHRRRRLHRLEPRARAARARRRGARARQLLDRQPREPRRARRRDRRGRAAQLRARPQRGPRRRGRLPPRRARLGAALGAGSAHLERRQRRGDAQRPARRARRGRAARRLLVELVGLRLEPRAAGDRGRRRPTRSRRTASPSSPPSATASLQPRLRRRSRRSCCATSTSSARGRARSRSTRRWCRSSSPRSPPASRSRSTATASSRATSPTSTTSSTRRSAPPTRRRRERPRSSTSRPARRRASTSVADTIGEHPRQAGREACTARRAPGDIRDSWADVTRGARACSAASRRSALEEGLRRTADGAAWLMSGSDGPVRVLRLIARLNMGGPALHVAYLTKGLEERGYDDDARRRARSARGESSMSFVAEELGVEVVPIPQLHREISPLYDTLSVTRARAADPAACGRTSCTRTPRRPARSAASPRSLAGDARPPIVVHTFHGHVLRGYFDPARTAAFRDARAAARDARRRGSSPSAPRCATTSSSSASRRPSKFSVIRLGIELDSAHRGRRRATASELRRLFGVPPRRASSSAGSAA